MKLILVGCEYTGKTTLVGGVQDWIEANMGDKAGVHDHFTIPYIAHRDMSDEERQQVLGLSPGLKEEFQRYMIIYHLQSGFLTMPHHLLVGFHIEEAVYAPRYFGYGRPGEYSERTGLARSVEKDLLAVAPETVLVLLRASAEVIRGRMKEQTRPHGLVKEGEVEQVLELFEEQYDKTMIRKKFALDTSDTTVEETLAQFVEQVRPHLTESDRLRMLTHTSTLG